MLCVFLIVLLVSVCVVLPVFRMFCSLLFCLQPLHALDGCLLYLLLFVVCVFAVAVYVYVCVIGFKCMCCDYVLVGFCLCLWF